MSGHERRGPIQLTVLLTSYNYSQYISGALELLLPQLEPGFELIVIDDGSSDDSIGRIEAAIAGHAEARLIRNETNTGIHAVLNQGLALARGEFFICASADDRIRPGLLASCVEMLERHPEAGLCTAPVVQIDGLGRIAAEWAGPELPERRYHSPDEARRLMRVHGFWFCGATTMFRTAALREAGGFLLRLGNLADSFVSQELALKRGFCSLPGRLAEVRILEESYSCSERHDLEKTHALRLEAAAWMRERAGLFPPDFIVEWMDLWGFLDALKAWHRATLWTQRRFLGEGLALFRHDPGVTDRLFALLVGGLGGLQFIVFGFWGLVVLAGNRLFRHYLRPRRFGVWLRKQFRSGRP